MLDRLKTAIGELGYEAVVEDLISDDLIGGDDSLLASDEVMVIPGHMDDTSRPILLAVTGLGRQEPCRSQGHAAGQGTADRGPRGRSSTWSSSATPGTRPLSEEEHREELEGTRPERVRFLFLLVGVPDKTLVFTSSARLADRNQRMKADGSFSPVVRAGGLSRRHHSGPVEARQRPSYDRCSDVFHAVVVMTPLKQWQTQFCRFRSVHGIKKDPSPITSTFVPGRHQPQENENDNAMFTRIQVASLSMLKLVDQRLDRFQALVGPNASGKTTFLDLVITAERPDAVPG